MRGQVEPKPGGRAEVHTWTLLATHQLVHCRANLAARAEQCQSRRIPGDGCHSGGDVTLRRTMSSATTTGPETENTLPNLDSRSSSVRVFSISISISSQHANTLITIGVMGRTLYPDGLLCVLHCPSLPAGWVQHQQHHSPQPRVGPRRPSTALTIFASVTVRVWVRACEIQQP